MKSGRTLCKLANKLQRGIIKKINKGKNSVMERENLANFRQACKMLGLKDHDIFDVNDLYKQEDLGAVINTIHALSRIMENCPTYKGKLIKGRGAQISELVPSIPEESELDKSGDSPQVSAPQESGASVSAPHQNIPLVSLGTPKHPPPQDLPSVLSPRHQTNTLIRIHHTPEPKDKQILSPRHERLLIPLTIDVSPVLKAAKHEYREMLSPIVKDYIALIQKSRLDERNLGEVDKKLKEMENQKVEWEKEKKQLEDSQKFFRRTSIFLGGVVIGVTCSYCLFIWNQKKH
uniref:Calponin-homology (CH) domain-containing protein n=1 Tax=Arcella intermedia TaxID=1963864 RepID=A0A6B2LBR8_9EUKA